MITAPGTRHAVRAAIAARPRAARIGSGWVRLPTVTKVFGSSWIRPAFFRPIRARNRPIPALIAIFSDVGMALITHSRTGRMLRTMNSMPEMTTAPRATCQGTSMPRTTA